MSHSTAVRPRPRQIGPSSRRSHVRNYKTKRNGLGPGWLLELGDVDALVARDQAGRICRLHLLGTVAALGIGAMRPLGAALGTDERPPLGRLARPKLEVGASVDAASGPAVPTAHELQTAIGADTAEDLAVPVFGAADGEHSLWLLGRYDDGPVVPEFPRYGGPRR